MIIARLFLCVQNGMHNSFYGRFSCFVFVVVLVVSLRSPFFLPLLLFKSLAKLNELGNRKQYLCDIGEAPASWIRLSNAFQAGTMIKGKYDRRRISRDGAKKAKNTRRRNRTNESKMNHTVKCLRGTYSLLCYVCLPFFCSDVRVHMPCTDKIPYIIRKT